MTPDKGLSMTDTPEMKAATDAILAAFENGEMDAAGAIEDLVKLIDKLIATRTPEIPASDDVVEKVARAIYESAQAENGNHSALPWHIVRDGETAARWFAYARAAIAAYQASGEKDRG